ncbi:hypothetical protein GCM10009118_07950 [Wandonia haliotis]|uniref:Uncharacterized protein n=1 Tax=Wandonia haliotis TaxID=574963 RepID=A0ABN1MM83_9FLAO
MAQKKYNVIYHKLVDSDTDLVGHIAYSLYKRQKLEYIENYKKENSKPPTDKVLEDFHRMSLGDVSIENLKVRAEGILQEFTGGVLGEALQNVEEDIRRNQQNILAEIIEPLKPENKWKTFGRGVLQSMSGAFAFALIVAGVWFIKGNHPQYTEPPKTPNETDSMSAPSSSVEDSTHQQPVDSH